MKTKVLLVDNHQILIDSLRLLIEQQSDLEVAGEAKDGLEAITLAKKLSPQVIIMDIKMPGLNGIEASKEILAANPGIKIIALSVSDDIAYVRNMLSAGAYGYLLKESSGEELIVAIHNGANGDRYVSREINSVILKDYQQNLKKRDKVSNSPLSSREIEVLKLLAKGLNSKEIGAKLDISVKTVDAHRRKIMEKLHISSVAGLTRYAIRSGLVSLDE